MTKKKNHDEFQFYVLFRLTFNCSQPTRVYIYIYIYKMYKLDKVQLITSVSSNFFKLHM